MKTKDRLLLENIYEQKVKGNHTRKEDAYQNFLVQEGDGGRMGDAQNPWIAPFQTDIYEYHDRLERGAKFYQRPMHYRFNGDSFIAYPPNEQTPQNSLQAQIAAHQQRKKSEGGVEKPNEYNKEGGRMGVAQNPVIAPFGADRYEIHGQMESRARFYQRPIYYRFNGDLFIAYPPEERTPQNSLQAQIAAHQQRKKSEWPVEDDDLGDDEGFDPNANPFGESVQIPLSLFNTIRSILLAEAKKMKCTECGCDPMKPKKGCTCKHKNKKAMK